MTQRVSLATILTQWGRIGCIGFGGPPTHILLLRRLCVRDRGWLTAEEFEDGIAATTLLPGPASTQLAIFCAWRLRGLAGALTGAIAFICPGLVLILALAALFLGSHPPLWVTAAAAGAGAAVPAVALHAASGLVPASWRRAGHHVRWVVYLLLGAAATILVGPWVVLVLVACGLVEVASTVGHRTLTIPLLTTVTGGLPWVAFKVGALSYGGGFVIVPLMQADAVDRYHWLTGGQFLNAVALGQITPGPVVQTVAVIGYAAGGLAGGLLAAFIAFAPSVLFVVLGGPHFERLRASATAQSFLDGSGPAAIGAIAGSAVPLGLSLHQSWQAVVLCLAALWLLVLRRGVVTALLGAGGLGVLAALVGLP